LYSDFVASHPGHWRAAGVLGDLLVRAGRSAEAVERYVGLAARHRLVAPDECVLACRKIIALNGDVTDEGARALLVGVCMEGGNVDGAQRYATRADEWKSIADALFSRRRAVDAVVALERALAVAPSDHETRLRLARQASAAEDFERARSYLPSEADHVAILQCRLDVELAAGNTREVRSAAVRLLKVDRARLAELVSLAASVAPGEPAFQCVDVATDALLADGQWQAAAAVLEPYVARVPHHIPALMKLVEVCVDGDLCDLLRRAQAGLADAYLEAGHGREARVIAEDLALEDPDEPANIVRFRRALELLGEPDPDGFIAERLADGQPYIDFGTGTFEAAPAERAVIEREPEALEPPVERALRLQQAGRGDEAIDVLRSAVRQIEHRFEAALLLARTSKERGENQEAIEWFDRARQAAPTPEAAVRVLYDLGVTLVAAGEAERALAVFRELGRAEPRLGHGTPSDTHAADVPPRSRHPRK
jgi:tetratricopeptide (TPR) repeat protein